MDEKIIEKYRELKAIVAAYLEGDKADPEKFIEDAKTKAKEIVELEPEAEETPED